MLTRRIFWAAVLAAVPALTAVPAHASAASVVMAGPMFHCNFASGRPAFWSFGFEVSYWGENLFPVGVDGGVEYDTRGKVRLYGEWELGFIYAGGALGPVVEYGRGSMAIGLQGSAWANFFAGGDFRVRKLLGSPQEWAPGYYFKFPVHMPDWGEPVY